eukprot:TRINITY_DN48607_c0_g1_i1.p2 TRINITY_DN48607_c0_g1~~TRINITY_DN48607_c0_g1_i1.p2  ORF type:complete len:230 (-),score=55.89 TRINITY_DN48607_c0_g1_i1:206-805(-)
MASAPFLNVDPFAFRQFVPEGSDPLQISMTPEDFAAEANRLYASGDYPLVDGYAPFCKHIFVPNFAKLHGVTARITDANLALLRSGYEARTPEELPVLTRWFQKEDVGTQEAKFLDLILYSREQIIKENEAQGKAPDARSEPWAIVSVKAQDVDRELPMQPITMMRNALGKEEGGSGVPLDRQKYDESVAFWRDHAPVK